MNRLRLVCASVVLACVAIAADKPEEIQGKVVNVVDGDTITLRSGKDLLSIRLEGIDAPERGQAYWEQSRDYLKDLVTDKEVVVKKTGTDKYNRTLGNLIVGKTNACEKMVEQGWAWHFKRYSADKVLAKLETEAIEARRGLWADINPMPPWEYRAKKADVKEVKAAPPAAPAMKDKPKVAEQPAKQEAKYWLTTASGIRHNAGCKHYGSTKSGRSCTKDEGRACKICGG